MHFCDQDLLRPVRSLPHVYEKSTVTCGIISSIILNVWYSTILRNLLIQCTYSETEKCSSCTYASMLGDHRHQCRKSGRSETDNDYINMTFNTTVEAPASGQHSTLVKYCLAISRSLAHVHVLRCELKNCFWFRGNIQRDQRRLNTSCATLFKCCATYSFYLTLFFWDCPQYLLFLPCSLHFLCCWKCKR